MATINHQYEAPKLPGGWTADEKRFYNGVIDVFDDIYRRWGRLGEKDLSVKLRTLINDKADGETVTSLTTRIEQTESEIALKASSETVNALGERVSTAETSITQNATAISSKASQSDVNALGERVTTAESEIRQTPDKISAAVGGMRIGGTNLVLNTDTINGDKTVAFGAPAAGSTVLYSTYDGAEYAAQHAIRVDFTTGGAGANIYWFPSYSPALINGRTYTWQIKAYIADKAAGLDVDMGLEAGGLTTKHLTWGWQTYSHTFVYDSSATYKAFHINGAFAAGDKLFIADFKIEDGDKATAWTRHPDEQNKVQIGSNILIDAEHTEISTPYLDIDVSGTDGDMHIDENGISGGTGTFKTLNCPDVVKSTGNATYSGGLQEAFDAMNGRFLTSNVTISLSADQYGTFMLKGVYGVDASINIVGNGHSINGVLAVYNCKLTNVGIGGVTINGNGSSTPLVLIDAGYVSVIGATINGGGAGIAVDANYGTRLMMYDDGLYNAGNLIRLGHCTEGSLVWLRGGSCTNYLRADGARWTMSGTRPDGTYAQENTCLHAPENPDSLTIDYGTSQPPVTPVTTTSYTANVTGTYYPSGHWMSSNQMIQGRYDSTRYYGCMWFGASALSGKTIKSATLTIKRIAGAGKSSAVNVTLYTSPVTGKSGNPTTGAVSLGTLGKAANGESVTVTLPTSAIGVIAAGGALMLDPGDTVNASGKRYSSNYARFEGTDASAPVLTVTYQ